MYTYICSVFVHAITEGVFFNGCCIAPNKLIKKRNNLYENVSQAERIERYSECNVFRQYLQQFL